MDDHATEAAAVWVDIKTLAPWAKNPRKNDGEPVKAVMRSIKRFGFGSPILARRADGEIIAGHTRLKAAMALGLDRVPVRYLDLDPAEAHLLALADNKVAEKSRWDDALVTQILAEYTTEDAMDAGFTSKDLEKLGGALDPGDDEPMGTVFEIVVSCRDEDHQAELLAELEAKGLPCRLLML